MSSDICFLITVLCGTELLKCALKIDRDRLVGDVAEHPMEPENREYLHSLLPLHVQNSGPIVEVVELYEVVDLSQPTPQP